MENTLNNVKRNRIFYGMGVVGPTIFDTFIGSYLTLYATDVLGLDALYFASLLVVPRIVDVLIDFFIMYFVGKTRTRFGMYRPWLFNMAAMVLALISMFGVSCLDLGTTATLVVIVASYFISSAICDSLYWIPYTAMPGVMTEDTNELVKISSTKTIFDYTFSVMVAASTMPILLAFGKEEGDYTNPEGWLVCALIFGGISLTASLLCFAFLKTDLELEKKIAREYNARDIVRDYRNVITDKGFIAITALLFLTYLATYTNQTVSYYFYIYNLEIEELISYLSLIGAVVAVIVSLVAGKLQKKYGFKLTLAAAAVSLIASSIVRMFTYNVGVMVISGVLMVTGTTLLMILIYSLWPIVAKGMNSEKIVTPLNSTIGLSNIFGNIAIILSDLIGAAIISFSRYDADLPSQEDFTLDMFRYCTPAFTVILCIAMIFIIMHVYRKNANLLLEE